MFDIDCFRNRNYVISTPYKSVNHITWDVVRNDGGTERLRVIYQHTNTKTSYWRVLCFTSVEQIDADAAVGLNSNALVTSVSTGSTEYRAPRYLKHWQEVLTPIIAELSHDCKNSLR